jgi:integrase
VPKKLEHLSDVVRAKPSKRLPMVLTREEVRSVLAQLSGVHWLTATLMYGSGLRLMECLRLRVKDIDFGSHFIMVRGGKGSKDRRTLLPERAKRPLRDHLRDVRRRHDEDVEKGAGWVELPASIDRKYPPACHGPGIEWWRQLCGRWPQRGRRLGRRWRQARAAPVRPAAENNVIALG